MRRGHDFLAQATLLYRECKDCNKRTPHICTKCGLCYSCHWKAETTPKQTQLAVA